MKYVAAYLLATLGGDAEPSKKTIEDILGMILLQIAKLNTVFSLRWS